MHKYEFEIFVEDVDLAGIVYHPNYLKFADRARVTLLKDIHAPIEKLFKEDNISFVVVNCEIKYKSSLMLGDKVIICTVIQECSGASFVAHQTFMRGEEEAAVAKVKVACTSREGRLVRLPESLKKLQQI